MKSREKTEMTNEKQRKTPDQSLHIDVSSKPIAVGLIIDHLPKFAYRPTLTGHAIQPKIHGLSACLSNCFHKLTNFK